MHPGGDIGLAGERIDSALAGTARRLCPDKLESANDACTVALDLDGLLVSDDPTLDWFALAGRCRRREQRAPPAKHYVEGQVDLDLAINGTLAEPEISDRSDRPDPVGCVDRGEGRYLRRHCGLGKRAMCRSISFSRRSAAGEVRRRLIFGKSLQFLTAFQVLSRASGIAVVTVKIKDIVIDSEVSNDSGGVSVKSKTDFWHRSRNRALAVSRARSVRGPLLERLVRGTSCAPAESRRHTPSASAVAGGSTC